MQNKRGLLNNGSGVSMKWHDTRICIDGVIYTTYSCGRMHPWHALEKPSPLTLIEELHVWHTLAECLCHVSYQDSALNIPVTRATSAHILFGQTLTAEMTTWQLQQRIY